MSRRFHAVIAILLATSAAHPGFSQTPTPVVIEPLDGSNSMLLSDDTVASVRRQSFLQPRFDRPSAATLPNNFTAFPEFDGIIISGDRVALKIGGFVKADLISDFDPIDSTDSFDTTTIPVGAEDRENSRFHARQSRLSFDARWPVNSEVARAYVEFDFFGDGARGSDALRLRHAYGEFGRFTAGQTWTTFTDPSAVPQTLDFEGAVSNVNRRQGLVRWTQPLLRDRLFLAVALEDPRITIEAPLGVTGQGRTETPDFVTHLRLEADQAEWQAAMVIRQLGFQPTGQPVITGTAWGFNFTGSARLTERFKAYYQITFGEGIGSYRGSPDVVATGPTTAAVLPVFGWMVGAKVAWCDRLTSNLTFSRLELDPLTGQDPDNLRGTTYLAVNVINNPYERLFWGAEYLFGIRENISGAEGDAHRLQLSFGFYLP